MVEETDFSEDSMDEDIQESYYYYTVIEKIEQQHQENKRKGELFLKGRGLSELSKAEFEELQKMTNNFYLDPFAPEGKQIIINRQIFREREEYLKIHNERSEIDSDIDAWYGLNLYSILRDVDYIGSIAKAYNSNSFYFRIVSDLAFIHYMRKLHFPIRTARAIADPDEPTMSEQSMNERGVIIFGGYACDLNLEVTLDKREYDDIHLRGAFSLFFALRLSQIETNIF